MARKDRDLAGFGDVANISTNKNKHINVSANDDANDNVNTVINNDVDKEDITNIYVSDEDNKNVSDVIVTDVVEGVNIEDVSDEVNANEDFFDQLTKGGRKKKDEKIMRGFYLEPDIDSVINKLAKKSNDRGIKSKIVNEALRKVFTEKSWL